MCSSLGVDEPPFVGGSYRESSRKSSKTLNFSRRSVSDLEASYAHLFGEFHEMKDNFKSEGPSRKPWSDLFKLHAQVNEELLQLFSFLVAL